MKNTLILITLSALAAFGQQSTLTATTVAVAQGQGDRTITLTSATNVSAGTMLYVVDLGQTVGETQNVLSISGTTATVTRSTGSAVLHPIGSMVLLGGPQLFRKFNPTGGCTTAQTLVTPFVNTITGQQWLCSAKTLTWIAGWGNATAHPQINAASATASVAGTTAINGPLVHISGTNAITAFSMGVGWNGSGFCIIPDGSFTTTTGGTTSGTTIAIAIASTAVVNKTLCYGYDASNSKFTPSY